MFRGLLTLKWQQQRHWQLQQQAREEVGTGAGPLAAGGPSPRARGVIGREPPDDFAPDAPATGSRRPASTQYSSLLILLLLRSSSSSSSSSSGSSSSSRLACSLVTYAQWQMLRTTQPVALCLALCLAIKQRSPGAADDAPSSMSSSAAWSRCIEAGAMSITMHWDLCLRTTARKADPHVPT